MWPFFIIKRVLTYMLNVSSVVWHGSSWLSPQAAHCYTERWDESNFLHCSITTTIWYLWWELEKAYRFLWDTCWYYSNFLGQEFEKVKDKAPNNFRLDLLSTESKQTEKERKCTSIIFILILDHFFEGVCYE